MRPSLIFDRCPHTLASGGRCLGSRRLTHDHFTQAPNYGHAPHFAPCFELEPQTNDLAVLDNEIWLGERDYDLRMSGIDPDDACPAIVPFDLVRRRRA